MPDGGVFCGGNQNPFYRARWRGPQAQGQITGFGAAGGEHNAFRCAPAKFGDLRARLFDRSTGATPFGMYGRRIAER